MNRSLMMLFVGFTLALGACKKDEEDPRVSDDGTPLTADFTGDELPRATDIDGVEPADAELPIAVEGADDGSPGIVYSAVLGGYYIMRIQFPEGNFHYEYHLETDSWADDDSIFRQCGGTITQGWLYRVTGREEFRISARRGLDYLHGRLMDAGDGMKGLPSGGTPNMGASSLLTIATSVYALNTDDDTFDENLDALGAFLLTFTDPETGEFLKTDPYFLAPGQLLMAFQHLHAATGDEIYLDKLEQSVRWAIDNPDVHEWDPYFGLWANEPLTYLYVQRPDQAFADAAFAMADPIIDTQLVPGEHNKQARYDGGFPLKEGNTPGWSSGLRLEAVIDAYRLAVLVDDKERMQRYRQSALWATAFLLRLQYRAGETDDHPDPELLVGSWPFAFTHEVIRVDLTHHIANTLIKTAEYLELEDFPGKRDPLDVDP